MPSPQPEERPEDPEEQSLESTEQEITELEEHTELLLYQFANRAGANGWQDVPQNIIDENSAEWEKIALQRLTGSEFASTSKDEPLSIVLEGFAQDDEYYYILAALCVAQRQARYVALPTKEPIELAPDCTCGHVIAIYKELPLEEDLPEAQSDSIADGYALFVDELSLVAEAERFANGDDSGLIHYLLREQCELQKIKMAEIASLQQGVLSSNEESEGVGFHIVDSLGQRFYFEVSIGADFGGIRTFGPSLLQKDGLIPDTSFPESAEIPALEARRRVQAAILECGVEKISFENSKFPGAAWTIERDLTSFLSEWKPPVPWEIKVENTYQPLLDRGLYLVEVTFRDEQGNFLLPNREGPGCLRSTEPISLFYEVTPHLLEALDYNFSYALRLVAVPPSAGLTPVVHSLLKNPQTSLVARGIERCIASELELSAELAQTFRVSSVIVLDEPDIPDTDTGLLPPETGDTIKSLSLMCFHERGASVVTLRTDETGIVDLGMMRVIYAFEGLKEL